MRKKIYELVHVYQGTAFGAAYKYFMVAVIVISLYPLAVKGSTPLTRTIEGVCLGIYILDFLLRWITADMKYQDPRWISFVRFPFRLLSLIDLLSILALISSILGLAQGLQLAALFKVFRVIRIFRYSRNVDTILNIFKRSRKALLAVGSLAVGYILVSALIMFNVEPDSFENFFAAVYWSTVSLTTVGYGDLYPVTTLGRCVAMVSSLFGIAIVALPAGIITAEYMKALTEDSNR